jgi:toxin-antitoxin system PIN domain toxin
MLMPDVNVLVYAHRVDEAVHEPYRQWLTDLVNGPEPFALSVLVAVGFVRVVTNPRIYEQPTPTPTALAAIDQIVTHPRCRVVAPSSQHWQQVAGICRLANAAGKLVADAQHAAVAIAEGCTWITRDGDFAAFAPHGLRWQHLLLS